VSKAIIKNTELFGQNLFIKDSATPFYFRNSGKLTIL